jgi:hypothetical protein
LRFALFNDISLNYQKKKKNSKGLAPNEVWWGSFSHPRESVRTLFIHQALNIS